jgi:hypothetical protein
LRRLEQRFGGARFHRPGSARFFSTSSRQSGSATVATNLSKS